MQKAVPPKEKPVFTEEEEIVLEELFWRFLRKADDNGWFDHSHSKESAEMQEAEEAYRKLDGDKQT